MNKELPMEFQQNTINDFYPTTKAMIDDLLDLVCIKLDGCLKYGKLYTKACVMEAVGFAIRYTKNIAYGGDFQGEK